ncbi:MAG TPA: hypothetical protein VL625_01460 [Patescibacteria group bacterium]|nr:hypothetical protein [Patescibacteria group bacterium]
MQFRSFLKKNGPFLFLLAALAPWTVIQMVTALNENHAWLLVAASRLLDGHRQLTDFYEPNPPLSVLLYVPAVVLSRLTAIPVWYTHYLFGLAALLFSALAVFRLLSQWPESDRNQNVVFVSAYVLAGTILAAYNCFAERDEFLILGLVPFLIVQVALTAAIPLPRLLKGAVLTAGAAAVLLRPHYGLLPMLLLIHRAAGRRKEFFSVLRDPDFMALAAGVVLYGIVLYILFPDYLPVIFPDFLKLYGIGHSVLVVRPAVLGTAAVLALILTAGKAGFSPALRRAAELCCIGANLSLMLFVIQDRGYFYQLIPAVFFFNCAGGLILYGIAGKFSRSPAICVWTTVVGLTALAYTLRPVHAGLPSHWQYARLPVPQAVASAGPGQSFYEFSQNMETISQSAIYTGVNLGSRFPALWWLPGLDKLPPAECEKKFAQYAGYMTEDLRRYKPKILIIGTGLRVFGTPDFDFMKFFGRYPPFHEEMSHYRKTGQLKDNRRNYQRGTPLDYDFFITYDIYERIPG